MKDVPDSSNLAIALYNRDTRELEVTFHHGKTYCYSGVDPETWQEFREAPSTGTYYREYIDGHFEHSILP